MNIKDVELLEYDARMRLKSIEAAITRVDPDSEEFEDLLEHAHEVKREQDRLFTERLKAVRETFSTYFKM